MKSLFSLFFLFISLSLISQESLKNQLFYQISPTYNFKQSIISITFDDCAPKVFTVAEPLLNERDLPTTFYIVTSRLKDTTYKRLVKEAYLSSHEIGSHTVNHVRLPEYDSLRIDYELKTSQKSINSLLGGNKCLSFAYPGSCLNDIVIRMTKKYYFSARAGIRGYNLYDFFDKYKLSTMTYMSGLQKWQLKNIVNQTSQSALWLIETFHGIDGEGWASIDPSAFAEHLDYLKTLENITWFATVSTVIKYSDERDSLRVFCDECDDKFYRIRLEDNLNDSIYNQPLSISLKVPNNWEGISILGAEFVKMIFKDGFKFLLFNALPNNKEILIKPEFISAVESLDTRFIQIKPNPFNEYIDISFETTKPSDIQIILKDIYNKVQLVQDVVCGEPINTVKLITDQVSKGSYILELINKTSNERLISKIIKVN